jgi:uncharacterized protein involved in cysteine biosynthesis
MTPYSNVKGFFRAMLEPFKGIGHIMVRPSLWLLALTPTLTAFVLAMLSMAAASKTYSLLIARFSRDIHSTSSLGQAELWLIRALVVCLLLLLALVLLTILTPPLCAPWMDKLVVKVDQRVMQEPPFATAAWRAVRVTLVGALVFAIPQVTMWLLSVLIAPLAWLFAAIGFAVSALALAYDAFDWPLARRGLGVRGRLSWMQQHWIAVTGLGFGVSIIGMVPGLSIVLLPAIVVGAVKIVNVCENNTLNAA